MMLSSLLFFVLEKESAMLGNDSEVVERLVEFGTSETNALLKGNRVFVC